MGLKLQTSSTGVPRAPRADATRGPYAAATRTKQRHRPRHLAWDRRRSLWDTPRSRENGSGWGVTKEAYRCSRTNKEHNRERMSWLDALFRKLGIGERAAIELKAGGAAVIPEIEKSVGIELTKIAS